MTQHYDFIIIGAGSTGCAVAYRLVENTDAKVLLIEAGGRDTRPEIHKEDVPSTMSLWGAPGLDWGYTTEPQIALNNRRVAVARGKVWGGSSSVNAMLHVRGNRFDYDYWNYLGNEGWSYQEVLPYFKKMEDFEGGSTDFRGAGGPLSVIVHADPTPVSKQLFPAALELGLSDRGTQFDYNGEQQDGSPFFYQATKTREHQRASTAVAYLYPILDRPNFSVISQAQVTRLLLEKTCVVGVEYLQDGQIKRVTAEQEVIVCAGAYESPKLLMLSGIGPAETLKAHGIQVIVDLPGVGQNLQDHMILGVAYLNQQEQAYAPTLIAETGFFIRTREGIDRASPDLQMKFGGLKFVSSEYDRPGAGFTFAPVLIQPQSLGYVTLRSNNPLDVALLQPNYLTSDADMQVFLKGIKLSRELAHTKAFKDFLKEELAPGVKVTSESELREFIRNNASTLWHPVGTCKMGHDRMAVVNPQLQVRGIERLRVADASVMPHIVAGNTNAACIMIGEKLAEIIQSTY